ncbi:MAG: hypothetical protein WB676_20590, partial [Bryobacteraceae bacterium]
MLFMLARLKDSAKIVAPMALPLPLRRSGIAAVSATLLGCDLVKKPSAAPTGPKRTELFDLKSKCSKLAAEFE